MVGKSAKIFFSETSIENFKSYQLYTDWSDICVNNESNDPNSTLKKFYIKFNEGFNLCFPTSVHTSYRKKPRKEWMTPGLVKSCENKSELFKKCKKSNSNEPRVSFVNYKNKSSSILFKAEWEFCTKT